MLLRLPILHYARVNPLLLLCNKHALFINSSAYNLAGAVKLFLLNTIQLICSNCLGFLSRGRMVSVLVIHNKRRAVL